MWKKYFYILPLLIILFTCVNCFSQKIDIKTVKSLIKSEEWDKAITLLERFTQLDSQKAEVFYLLGQSYAAKGKYIEMNASFGKSLSLAKKYKKEIERVRFNLLQNAHSFVESNNWDQAIALLEQITKSDSQNATAFFLLGKSYAGKDKIEEMERSFLRCLQLSLVDYYREIDFFRSSLCGEYIRRGNSADNITDRINLYLMAKAIYPEKTAVYFKLIHEYILADSLQRAKKVHEELTPKLLKLFEKQTTHPSVGWKLNSLISTTIKDRPQQLDCIFKAINLILLFAERRINRNILDASGETILLYTNVFGGEDARIIMDAFGFTFKIVSGYAPPSAGSGLYSYKEIIFHNNKILYCTF